MRIACDPHWQTPGPIKHPRRQFQPALPRSALQRAAQNRAVQLLNRFMDKDDVSSPGMPGIKNLALLPNFSTVGVTPPSCTMPSARIRASVGRHRWLSQQRRCAQRDGTLPRSEGFAPYPVASGTENEFNHPETLVSYG